MLRDGVDPLPMASAGCFSYRGYRTCSIDRVVGEVATRPRESNLAA
jgi:hypothetical protein